MGDTTHACAHTHIFSSPEISCQQDSGSEPELKSWGWGSNLVCICKALNLTLSTTRAKRRWKHTTGVGTLVREENMVEEESVCHRGSGERLLGGEELETMVEGKV